MKAAAIPSTAANLQFGAYEADLNPALGLPIAGYLEPKMALGFSDRLYAKAISLGSGDARVLLASLDLVGLAKQTCDEIRDEMEAKYSIPRDNVVLLATHTHSGPETLTSSSVLFLPPGSPRRTEIEANIEGMKREILFALEQAMKNEEPVDSASVSTILVRGLFTNRNDPSRKIDGRLTTLRLKNSRSLFLVNHNCHPTVLGANNLSYSADFPGYVSQNLSKEFGATQVNCITGSCGDVSTRLTLGNEFASRRNISNTRKYGKTIAGLVSKSLESTTVLRDLSLRASSKELRLRTKRHPNSDESEELRRQIEEKISRTRDATKRSALELSLTGIKIWQETLEANDEKLPSTVEFALGVVSLGEDEFALGWASGELCSQTGLELKEKSRFKTVMLSGYGNGDVGYIPTPEAYKNLEYEAVSSPLEEDATRMVERELMRLLA